MTLTILQLFKRYSELRWYRKVFIERYDATTDTFETDWFDISQYLIKDSVKTISKQLTKDNYSFGKVLISNCNLEFQNIYGELSDEDNPNSVFKNWQRHNSKIKIVEGYVDDKTDPNNHVNVEAIVFLGLIDDFQAKTSIKYTEKFVAKDIMSVLERLTMADIGTVSATTIDTVVYEILNRDAFTKYFTVDNDSAFINAGYNATSVDMTQYDDDETVLAVLENLALGHSIFYVDPDDNTFYFKSVTPTAVLQYEFKDVLAKRITIDNYMTGADKVIEDWYWEDTNLSSISTTHKYNTSQKLNIKGVTNSTQRQNLLDAVKALTNTKKQHFDVVMPYFPIIKMLDRINFTKDGITPEDAFILGVGRLDIDKLRDPIGAINLIPSDEFFIREIKHSKQKTTFSCQLI